MSAEAIAAAIAQERERSAAALAEERARSAVALQAAAEAAAEAAAVAAAVAAAAAAEAAVAAAEAQAQERKNSLILQLRLLENRAKHPAGSTTETGSASAAQGQRWEFGARVYHDLLGRVRDSGCCVAGIEAAVKSRVQSDKCTPAPIDAFERTGLDNVHSHTNPVVSGTVDVLHGLCADSSLTAADASPARRPICGELRGALLLTAVVQERHYDDRNDLDSPDECVVRSCHLFRPRLRLTAESQLVVLEYKRRSKTPLVDLPCIGELQGAGYAAQKLSPLLLECVDVRHLSVRALALYSDSVTSSLIEVSVTFEGVVVRACRMPLLPGAMLPAGTSGTDGGFGAVALAYAVIDSVHDDMLRAQASETTITVDGSSGAASPVAVTLLGRGAYGRVLALPSNMVAKVPASMRTPQAKWAAHIVPEWIALTLLARATCRHIPELVAVAARKAPLSTAVAAALNDGLRKFAAVLGRTPPDPSLLPIVRMTVGARADDVAALLLRPVCSSLVGACDDIRLLAPVISVRFMQCATLAFVIPILRALQIAAACGISHRDLAIRNVMLADTPDEVPPAGSCIPGVREPVETPTDLAYELHARWNVQRFAQDVSDACAAWADLPPELAASDMLICDSESATQPRLSRKRRREDTGTARGGDESAADSSSVADPAGPARGPANVVMLVDWGCAQPIDPRNAGASEGADAYQCLHLVRDIVQLLLPKRASLSSEESGLGDAGEPCPAGASGKHELEEWQARFSDRFAKLHNLWNAWKPLSLSTTGHSASAFASGLDMQRGKMALPAEVNPVGGGGAAAGAAEPLPEPPTHLVARVDQSCVEPVAGAALDAVLFLLGFPSARSLDAADRAFVVRAGRAGGCLDTALLLDGKKLDAEHETLGDRGGSRSSRAWRVQRAGGAPPSS